MSEQNPSDLNPLHPQTNEYDDLQWDDVNDTSPPSEDDPSPQYSPSASIDNIEQGWLTIRDKSGAVPRKCLNNLSLDDKKYLLKNARFQRDELFPPDSCRTDYADLFQAFGEAKYFKGERIVQLGGNEWRECLELGMPFDPAFAAVLDHMMVKAVRSLQEHFYQALFWNPEMLRAAVERIIEAVETPPD